MKINFLGLPDHPQAQVALLPISLEVSTSWIKGTKFAPLEILKVSPNLEFLDEETYLSPHEELGFYTYPLEELPLDLERALERIEELTKEALEKFTFPILIGGEHTLTLPALRAFKRKYPSLRVVHIDAHLDFRETYLGTKINHATVMRRVFEELKIPIFSLGIRALSAEEYQEMKSQNINVVFSYRLKREFPLVLEEMVSFIEDYPVYLTLDLDGLDPSLAPGVGTPEPGGLSWEELLKILQKLAQRNLIGMDIVETSPHPYYPFTEFLVGKIILKVTAYLAKKRKNDLKV